MKIYSTVRSRTLIDYFFSIGICIPYKRVLQISKYLYKKLSFHLNDACCFKKGIIHHISKGQHRQKCKVNICKVTLSWDKHLHFTICHISDQGTDLPSIASPETLLASKWLSPLSKEYSCDKPLPYNPGKSHLFTPVCVVNFDTLGETPNL